MRNGCWLPQRWVEASTGSSQRSFRDEEVGTAFYGHLFRPSSRPLSVGDPFYGPADINDGLEAELLLAWWEEASKIDAKVVSPRSETLVRVPGSAQAGLRALSRSRYFAGVAMRAMVFDVKQVSRYLTDPELRFDVRSRVVEAIDSDTRVIIAHSLGSVVAYEALCMMQSSGIQHDVRALITLGSPHSAFVTSYLIVAAARSDRWKRSVAGYGNARVDERC